jgi:hypothetical protein
MPEPRSSWPETIAEAVEQLLGEMSAESKAAIAALPERGLSSLYFGLRQYIRNGFGLWEGNQALLTACTAARASAPADRPGGSYLRIHPDEASSVILRALWKRLQA